jgi:hypothetical protein
MLPSYYNFLIHLSFRVQMWPSFLIHLKASEYNVTILDIEREKRKG